MPVQQLLALDVGNKRTGVARASAIARLAEPLSTVPTAELMPVLKKLIDEFEVDTVIVGLPRSLNGDDTAQTKWVRDWTAQAQKQFPQTTFHLQDEALTTKQAEAAKNVTDVDAYAAAIILQDFLDARGENK